MTDEQCGPGVRIGALAAELGINPKTIRYYESIGLLPPPRRLRSGYRVYGAGDRQQLRFIAKAKAIGLSLDQISGILAMRRAGEQPCRHVAAVLDQKLASIDAQIGLLIDLRRGLLALRTRAGAMTACDAPVCAIIDRGAPTSSIPALDLPVDGKV